MSARVSDIELRVLSFLLQFPDAGMVDELQAARGRIRKTLEPATVDRIEPLIEYLAATPVLALQENFSALFDLNPATCMNLTYHRWGDKKERGAALARFARALSEAGLEPAGPELPDSLPLVLELLSVNRRDCRWILAEYRQVPTLLAERLSSADSPYAGLFSLLSEMAETARKDTQGDDHG